MSNFSLIAKFGMDASGVKTDLKQLKGEVADFASDWAKIGLAAGAGAFIALSKGALDLADSLSNASQNIGINVISLQALEAQHKRNGVSNEDLIKALEKTKEAAIGAANGDEKAANALAVLHIKASDFIKLPLDQQYAAIAKGAAEAKDQNSAYAAVADLFGSKVGPKMMGSLRELGEVGLPGVVKGAREAGQVMEKETIAALDKAGDAIDDFKRKATITVGNILVNFRTEEGFELIFMQVRRFGELFIAKVADAVNELGQMIWAVFSGSVLAVAHFFQDKFIDAAKAAAAAINSVLPEKFQINIANLDQLKSGVASFGDEIVTAIATTHPSTFTKDVDAAWDPVIKKQQALVDKVNATDFKEAAKNLTDAGNAIGAGMKGGAAAIDKALDNFFGSLDKASSTMKDGAKALTNGAEDAANTLDEGGFAVAQRMLDAARQVKATLESVTIGRSGKDYSEQSTTSLQGVLDNINKQLNSVGAGGGLIKNASVTASGAEYGDSLIGNALKAEAQAVQNELKKRQQFQQVYDTQGSEAALRKYGDTDYQRLTRDLTSDTKRTANALETLNAGLSKAGLLPK